MSAERREAEERAIAAAVRDAMGRRRDDHGHEMNVAEDPCGCVRIQCLGDPPCDPDAILARTGLAREDVLCERHRAEYLGIVRRESRSRWEDALDVLVHLHDEIRARRLLVYWDGRGGTTLADLEREAREDDDGVDMSDALQRLGRSVVLDLLDGIGRAEPVYVSPDVCDAWREVAGEFEPEPIADDEVFSRRALVVFPRAVRFGNGGWPVRALLWDRFDDSTDRPLPDWLVVGFSLGGDLAARAKLPPNHPATGSSRWVMSCQFQIPVGYTVDGYRRHLQEVASDARAKGHELDLTWDETDSWRELQSFWRMAASFVKSRERPDRATRRAAKRARLDIDAVTVIRLRRLVHRDPDAHRDVDWQCRWIVRGHWRRLADGRQTYVHPYVKGPEGLPLRVTERVWEFVR